MASKKEQIANLEDALAEANQRAHRNARDADYYRNREARRAEVEYQERQRKLKQAERDERAKRIENIGAGLLPLKHATQWAIVHEEDSKPGIEVFVPLTPAELNAAQGYLEGRSKSTTVSAYRNMFDGVRMQEAINRMSDAQRRIQRLYI